jgi:hypothetical protein
MRTEVLAMPHGGYAERRALARDGGADDQRDAVVFKDAARVSDASSFGPQGTSETNNKGFGRAWKLWKQEAVGRRRAG